MRTYILLLSCLLLSISGYTQESRMMFGDASRTGVPFSKDPHVVNFKGRYLMYYTIRPKKEDPDSGMGIGIASSKDLINWTKVGEITPAKGAPYEKNGLCAPGALVRDGKVHLFYQTYGNREKDAICHAISTDGIHFDRDPTNPIFHPTGDWNCGRAIDAEVCEFKGRYFLYFATRDKDFKIQMQGVATAPLSTDFNREDWIQAADSSILYPVYPWEGECIEAASITVQDGKMYMFYAGAYNNWPQQIGAAVSEDGITWKRLFKDPFLPNGKPGEWNESESGHPHIFTDLDGRTYLFYQGNNDKGKTWYLSQKEVYWKNGLPTFEK
ncbi:MAG: family 43 glycosylhydrolase [Tannerellaceae bacterium]|nr:family 43 glycosylhydrolase [Tannerellaceae bacterium]